MTVLLREAIGDRLRHARTNSDRTLRDIARAARVSLGYLSEVERGRKEASSELLAAICEALDLPLSELLVNVATDVSALNSVDDALPEGETRHAVTPAADGATGDSAGAETAPAGDAVPAAVLGASLAPGSSAMAATMGLPAATSWESGRTGPMAFGNELSDLRLGPGMLAGMGNAVGGGMQIAIAAA